MLLDHRHTFPIGSNWFLKRTRIADGLAAASQPTKTKSQISLCENDNIKRTPSSSYIISSRARNDYSMRLNRRPFFFSFPKKKRKRRKDGRFGARVRPAAAAAMLCAIFGTTGSHTFYTQHSNSLYYTLVGLYSRNSFCCSLLPVLLLTAAQSPFRSRPRVKLLDSCPASLSSLLCVCVCVCVSIEARAKGKREIGPAQLFEWFNSVTFP